MAALATLLLPPGAGQAHEEREITFPDGTGSAPTHRTSGPQLLVCKTDRADFETRVAGFDRPLRERNLTLFDQCQDDGFRHLQEAVDAAEPGTIVRVLPGLYREEPSLAPPTGQCAAIDAPFSSDQRYQVLSYQQQVACPHEQNLVAVLGKRDLQIEGTGAGPEDVVVDAQFRKLNAIRADRADGFYLRNLTAQRTTFNAVYVIETDGFVIDRAVGRWNDEYGFLVFANDHGLLTDCEGYGNGDSAIYPGASSDINADAGHAVERYAVEITGCYGHHNLLGYSGTAGNSVWAHDNVFTDNAAGVATDSAFPDHPGMPQNHALFERNVIGDNNQDYYRYVRDGTCLKPYEQRGYEDGVVCPAVGLPAGTGVINPGGNYNIWRDNWVYGHDYAGFLTSWVPGFVRGDGGWSAQFDTSHHNRYLGNRMGLTPDGAASPNRLDFWWDGQGRGHCWQAASGAGAGAGGSAEPRTLPACGSDQLPAGLPITRFVAEPGKLLKLYVCAEYSQAEQSLPVNCEWYGASGLGRIEVQLALAEAVLLGLAFLAVFLRRLRSRLGFGSLLVALSGLGVGMFGTGYEATPLTPIGLALFGAGAVGLGLAVRSAGRPGYGWLTVALGGLALLGAVDRGLTMIPFLPVPPSLLRILVELVWFGWTLVVVSRDRAPAAEPA
ncbi:MAG: hypothetical protein GEV12_08060 [Micromonosporaceae bacterium]|nr:hypothetical protein [Micromonosporaceae bacterium]